ncbi:phosphatase PAP2 family protein [Saccharothrix luteola]|uniref:phosphatase PAP2 family protein n=1 Tax=Saccharothrix luteola TaxID=2893018 RepID=UPI001E49623A|nr:phosphatase PAP2 family protein [Saccharothrix luteola]MCC8243422.1 phosphatase PAP2 family protein [Saccharothrix luteola]
MRLGGTTRSGSDPYDGIVEVAAATPERVRWIFAWYTDLGLLIFGALFALTWWRARGRDDSGATAVALLAPVATVGPAVAWRKLLPWVVAMALLMVFARVFVGVHHPRDVIVGPAITGGCRCDLTGAAEVAGKNKTVPSRVHRAPSTPLVVDSWGRRS